MTQSAQSQHCVTCEKLTQEKNMVSQELQMVMRREADAIHGSPEVKDRLKRDSTILRNRENAVRQELIRHRQEHGCKSLGMRG